MNESNELKRLAKKQKELPTRSAVVATTSDRYNTLLSIRSKFTFVRHTNTHTQPICVAYCATRCWCRCSPLTPFGRIQSIRRYDKIKQSQTGTDTPTQTGSSLVSRHVDMPSAGLRNGPIVAVCGWRATLLIYVFHNTFYSRWAYRRRSLLWFVCTPALFESVVRSPGFQYWPIGKYCRHFTCACLCVGGEVESTWKAAKNTQKLFQFNLLTIPSKHDCSKIFFGGVALRWLTKFSGRISSSRKRGRAMPTH